MSNLLHTTYPIDIPRALEVAEVFRPYAMPYGASGTPPDPRVPNGIPQWLIAQPENYDVPDYHMEYINQIISDIDIVCKPRFYYQESNFSLPNHIDFNTGCSINFVLSDDPAPVTILDKDYLYTQGLLNTTVMHGVKNSGTERILLKLSIFDLDFEQVSEHLKQKGYAQ